MGRGGSFLTWQMVAAREKVNPKPSVAWKKGVDHLNGFV